LFEKDLFGLLYLECSFIMIFEITCTEMELFLVQVAGYLSEEFIVLVLRLSKISVLKMKT